MLIGPVPGSDDLTSRFIVKPAVGAALNDALRNSVLAPKYLEKRIAALFAADRPRTATDLLDRAIALRPGNPALVAAKFAVLRAADDRDGEVGFARSIAEDPRRPPEALLKAMAILSRSGIELDDPALVGAIANYRSMMRRARLPGLAEARLYRALGLVGIARATLRHLSDHAVTRSERRGAERELVRLALRNDRWLRDQRRIEGAIPAKTRHDRALVESRSKLFAEARGKVVNPHFVRLEPNGVEAFLSPLPELAFDHLVRRRLSDQRNYEAENCLLMVGNSLGGGGMERVMAETYRHFRSDDLFEAVDLALIDWSNTGPRAFYRDLAGIAVDEVIRLREGGEATHPFMLLPSGWRRLVQRLHNHVVATRPRVIHAWNDLTGLFAGFAGLLAGCPRIVVHFHHLPEMPKSGRTRDIASYPACYRLLLARPEVRPLFCSHAAASEYAKWWCIEPGERFTVLHNGISPVKADPAKRHAVRAILGIPADAPVIGTVFRFDLVKQPLLWAEAAIRLAGLMPEAHFLLVGDGPLRDATMACFAAAGLSDRAHFPGQVSNVPDHLAVIDLFWLTSQTEGLPTVLIEAQMAGIPAIAFDVGGVGETFTDGATGRLVPRNDIAAFVEATRSAIADQAWLSAAGKQAVERSQEEFSRKRFLAGLANIYGGSDRPT